MKNKISIFLITLVVGIIVMELSKLGFYLMNQPDSLLFYLGFLIIAMECFVCGWIFIKGLNKLFPPTEKKEEETK